MVLRFFIYCTAISICVRAYPSRLKILPGLAFYRTDDGHDDSDNSLMDKDKDLLKSMWNIVDKMDNKNQQPPAYNNQPKVTYSQRVDYQSPSSNELSSAVRTPMGGPPFHKPETPANQGNNVGVPGIPGGPGGPAGPAGHGPGGRTPPLGTPITTINVYSTYPGAVKGETPFTATTYHHAVQPYGNSFGATPFSSNSETRNNENRYNQNSIPNNNNNNNFDAQKTQRNNFDSFMTPGANPTSYESPPPAQDSIISQSQYESLMSPNGGMGQPFEGQMDNSEGMGRNMYDTSQNQGEEQGYGGGMENSAGSSPMQFMMPHMGENAPMISMDDMMQDHFQNMNAEQLRSQMF